MKSEGGNMRKYDGRRESERWTPPLRTVRIQESRLTGTIKRKKKTKKRHKKKTTKKTGENARSIP